MLNVGVPELVVVGGMVLVIYGPQRSVEIAKQLAKGIMEFRHAMEGRNEEREEPPKVSPAAGTEVRS